MIIIPMAGLSDRFYAAGYSVPKFKLKLRGEYLFHHSVKSFEAYFAEEKFLFIALKKYNSEKFISNECFKMGIKNFNIITLDNPTRGQAETIYQGIKEFNIPKSEPLLIFNIDTFRPKFVFPKEYNTQDVDGYLETFIGSGENWSNVMPLNKEKKTVKYTAEKQQISKYCCTGLYYWRQSKAFCEAFENTYLMKNNEEIKSEFFIAPLYNYLINLDKKVHYSIIDVSEVIICGTPQEYEDLCIKNSESNFPEHSNKSF